MKTTTRVPKEGTSTATWNVRTLRACGKVQELTRELKRYQRDILVFAEVRWTGLGETTTDEGHKIWHCGAVSKHRYNMAFIVRKEVVGSANSCTSISSRLFSFRISARPCEITTDDNAGPECHRDVVPSRETVLHASLTFLFQCRSKEMLRRRHLLLHYYCHCFYDFPLKCRR